jgi:hypothetical protein
MYRDTNTTAHTTTATSTSMVEKALAGPGVLISRVLCAPIFKAAGPVWPKPSRAYAAQNLEWGPSPFFALSLRSWNKPAQRGFPRTREPPP